MIDNLLYILKVLLQTLGKKNRRPRGLFCVAEHAHIGAEHLWLQVIKLLFFPLWNSFHLGADRLHLLISSQRQFLDMLYCWLLLVEVFDNGWLWAFKGNIGVESTVHELQLRVGGLETRHGVLLNVHVSFQVDFG